MNSAGGVGGLGGWVEAGAACGDNTKSLGSVKMKSLKMQYLDY